MGTSSGIAFEIFSLGGAGGLATFFGVAAGGALTAIPGLALIGGLAACCSSSTLLCACYRKKKCKNPGVKDRCILYFSLGGTVGVSFCVFILQLLLMLTGRIQLLAGILRGLNATEDFIVFRYWCCCQSVLDSLTHDLQEYQTWHSSFGQNPLRLYWRFQECKPLEGVCPAKLVR